MKFFMGKLWAVRLGTRQPEPRSAVSHWVCLSGGVDGPAFHRAGDSWSHSLCPGSPSHRETQNHLHGYLAGGPPNIWGGGRKNSHHVVPKCSRNLGVENTKNSLGYLLVGRLGHFIHLTVMQLPMLHSLYSTSFWTLLVTLWWDSTTAPYFLCTCDRSFLSIMELR